MALDLTAPHSIERNTVEVVATNTVRITGMMFDFNDEWAALEVSFGIESGGFSPVRTELWVFRGQPLATLMLMAPTGATRLAVLRDIARDITNRIQTTPGLKQQLKDNGTLSIHHGALSTFLAYSPEVS